MHSTSPDCVIFILGIPKPYPKKTVYIEIERWTLFFLFSANKSLPSPRGWQTIIRLQLWCREVLRRRTGIQHWPDGLPWGTHWPQLSRSTLDLDLPHCGELWRPGHHGARWAWTYEICGVRQHPGKREEAWCLWTEFRKDLFFTQWITTWEINVMININQWLSARLQ